MDLIQPTHIVSSDVIDSDQQIINQVKNGKTSKEQLKKVATEFEGIFVTKMLNLMDKTVNKEGGIFGEETRYLDNLKSFMFNEMGRQIASNPRTSFGFAKQIYEQMERYL